MYIVNGKNYCRIDMNCVYVNWLEEELDSQSLATSLLVKQVKISQKE
ncbi:hypothetical protein [Paenibacillus sp. UNC217MF]|uniref:Uncharacterized protein n=1 Tax=Paenibacillus alvei TaxID=44250 RepID=A0ABT4E317_PAEAL|nr:MULTISPECIES: hypothetical protein [unclassified Paenibacillus]MCY9528112.1 hypothetical protein [Paenibacillus alvei]SDF49233.1 hypothetical protein SAMN04488689_105160 [Paenibacillus sp. cl6col]